MSNKIVAVIIILVILAAAGVAVWSMNQQAMLGDTAGGDGAGIACPADAMACPDGTYVSRTGPNCTFPECKMVDRPQAQTQNKAVVMNGAGDKSIIWAYNPKPSDTSGIPHTEVSVMINGQRNVIGTYEGSCITIDKVTADGQKNTAVWPLLDGELTGAICWYAGGGTEVAAFEENGKIVIKTGALDEGSAETAGTRGVFKTVKSF